MGFETDSAHAGSPNAPSKAPPVTMEAYDLKHPSPESETAAEVAGVDDTSHDHMSNAEKWRVGWTGHAGSHLDAWLTASAAQIGQVMLTLPHAVALTGLKSAIPLMILYGCISTYTIHLCNSLYVQMKKEKIAAGTWYDPGTNTRRQATQYFEVVRYHCGKWAGAATVIITIIGLLSTSIAQVIACSSDNYYISASHSKRTYAIIWGAVLTGVFTLIPTFKHMRIICILGLVGTSYTAIYIWAESGKSGLKDNWATGPTSLENFFLGLNVFLSAFGGHGMSFEIMDSMWKPSKFDRVYPFSTAFTFFVTVPHSILSVLAFGKANVKQSNVYGVLPQGGWRTSSIVLMLFHQCVAYVIYTGPVFFMAEKLFGVHDKAFPLRVLARLPVAFVVWLFGVAFPFYGVINSFMGSFAGSLTAFILPTAVYLWAYRKKEARAKALKPPPRFMKSSWTLALFVNVVLAGYFIVSGLGFGMWASVLSFVQNIDTLGVFAACYQCAAPAVKAGANATASG